MMRSEAQEVCERENLVEMNEFKSWKLVEIGLEMRALAERKLEIFLFFGFNLFPDDLISYTNSLYHFAIYISFEKD